MGVPDFAADARHIMDVVLAGGVTINPGDLGYGMLTASPAAAEKAFTAKQRAAHKRHGTLGSADIRREVALLDRRANEMIDAITVDFDLPLAAVAPVRTDHPWIQSIDPDTFRGASVEGTVALIHNNGRLLDELARLSFEQNVALVGSSANMTGTGTKYRLEDIEPAVLESADLATDYGLCKYHLYAPRSSTMINFATMTVIRIGVGYELISNILSRYFGFECPPDPGFDALPLGHLWQPAAV